MSQAFLLVEKLVLHNPDPLKQYKQHTFYTCIRYVDTITNRNRIVCVKGYYPSSDKNIFYTCVKRDEIADIILMNRFEGEVYNI